jgi:RimJ/RimL family protein N-acetyltransferase
VITLRPPRDEDAEALFAACQDPEIQRWTGVPKPYLREHADAYLERVVAEREAGKAHAFLAIGQDGELLGNISVMELDRSPGYGELGYWVARDARGKGVASAAVTLLRDWSAAELGLELIELLIDVANIGSQRVAESTGFLDTGERRPAPRQTASAELTHAVYAWSPA